MPKKPTNDLTPEDAALWESFRHRVSPLDRKKLPRDETPVAVTVTDSGPPLPRIPGKPRKALVADSAADVDAATHARLRKGEMKIEGRLDLHGKNHEQAFESVRRFIHHAIAADKRCVLVITGKGNHPSESGRTLKALFPEWLNHEDIRPFIVSLHGASRKDGGSGAFYLLLRRNRK